MKRCDGRKKSDIRPMRLKTKYLRNADGSCLIECGNTKVVCTATLEDKVPPFLRNSGQGWLTAEYGMLPASCNNRIPREASRGKQSGRTQEIQRLIGRSLRSVMNFEHLGERTIRVDCDVIQGDGGTRTASITGAFVAVAELEKKYKRKKVFAGPLYRDVVAAISVGVVGGVVCSDLCYEEDSTAEVDMNVVMTGSGTFVEVQGTAEGRAFSQEQLFDMVKVAESSIKKIITLQKKAIA